MNSVNLIGRLTEDPELRRLESQDNRPVCELRIAVNGSREGQTTYVDVTTFDKPAEACAKHLRKGRQVAVDGRLVYREWTAKDGTKRSKHSVLGRVQFLGAGPNGQGTQPESPNLTPEGAAFPEVKSAGETDGDF